LELTYLPAKKEHIPPAAGIKSRFTFMK